LNYCPSCGSPNEKSESSERTDEAYPDVYFLDVVILCSNCNLGWNCIGTKKK
tara:strand:- start:1453 stop:1608 length:156 start_codon:yes stop_codon:yes gene_type:complete